MTTKAAAATAPVIFQRPCPKCAGAGTIELSPEMADVIVELPGTVRTLSEKLKVTNGSIHTRLMRMLNDGLIERHRARGGHTYEYRVHPDVAKMIDDGKRKHTINK